MRPWPCIKDNKGCHVKRTNKQFGQPRQLSRLPNTPMLGPRPAGASPRKPDPDKTTRPVTPTKPAATCSGDNADLLFAPVTFAHASVMAPGRSSSVQSNEAQACAASSAAAAASPASVVALCNDFVPSMSSLSAHRETPDAKAILSRHREKLELLEGLQPGVRLIDVPCACAHLLSTTTSIANGYLVCECHVSSAVN